MASASEIILSLLGQAGGSAAVALIFGARMDEAGTDGRSKFTIVAGGVAVIEKWDALEGQWNALMARNHVGVYHHVDFADRENDFEGWTDFKSRRFAAAQMKIVDKATYFEFAVAVENSAHTDMKQSMKGISGYKADSHYGMAFRVARWHICNILKDNLPGSKLEIVVEDGPFSADAHKIYQTIVATAGSRRQASNAEMLAGFASVPKGRMRSLEAADFLAGRAHVDLRNGQTAIRKKRHFILADRAFLKTFHDGMLVEKEKRRAFRNARFVKKATSED